MQAKQMSLAWMSGTLPSYTHAAIIEICKVIQHTHGINHITNKLHRNKLELTYEFIGKNRKI
jgi:hypothetical protein